MSESKRPGNVRPLDLSGQFVQPEMQLLEAASQWKCLACIVERKGAELQGMAEADLPPLRDAVTVMGGSAHCYEHIVVQRQSPLQILGQPNGFGG